MKQTKIQTLLFSTAGVGLAFVAITGLNLLFSPVRARLDLTADGLHTLSEGSRKILSKIDSNVEIRLYVSRGENRMPSALKNYSQTVEDLLQEFRAASGGKITIKRLDPEPDSDAEDTAKLDGIEPVSLGQMGGDPLYFGMAVSLAPETKAIPFLSPQREKLLEYDIARVISQVIATNKPVLGVMTPLPVLGGPAMNPMMMQMGRQPQQQPWITFSELKRDFTVESVPMDSDSIPEKIQVLMVVHPKDISEKAQYAIDQFILRGGKLIAFLDTQCITDNRNPNPMGLNLGGGSSLPKLLEKWGIGLDTSKVVADRTFSRELQGRDGRPQPVPAFLFLNADGVNRDDAVTGQSDNLWLPFAGGFTGKPADGLRADVLLKSSEDSQLVDGMTSQFNGAKILDDFAPSRTNYPLALRLSGKFKTAFPDGKPGATNAISLKEAKSDTVVYLFGDVDFLNDAYSVEVNPMLGMAMPRNGNLALVQNLVEQASGDVNLVGARGRASVSRPFTVVQKMEAEARARYQGKIEGLNRKVEELQSKLNDVQIKQEGNTSKIILTKDQQDAIANFKKQQVDARKDLRKERRNLDVDVKNLENRVKWLNIAAMPLLVSAVGIALAIARKNRTNAK
ncbi:MAG: Gldg family protein [Verrucomicrobia bacterium]|nr:Gldg family protein [Verrucomicrobiota bacterium]